MLTKVKESLFLSNLSSLGGRVSVEKLGDKGRGLFALEQFNAGSLLGVYPGATLSLAEFYEKQEFLGRALGYSFYRRDSRVLDPSDIFAYVSSDLANALALINEPDEGERINCLPLESKRYVWFLIVESIKPGEQFLTTYGPDYKRAYSTSLKLDNGLACLDEELLIEAGRKYPWLKQSIALVQKIMKG